MGWKPEVIKNPLPPERGVRRVIPMILQTDKRVVITLYPDKEPTTEIKKVQIIQGGKKISVRTIS